MGENDTFYRAAERRIEVLIPVLGALGAAWAAWKWGWWYGAGVLVGAVLSWLNFRWLKQALYVMASLAGAQAGAEKGRVPKGVYVKFFARYGLLILAVYVIFSRSWLPASALLAGLFAVVAAVMVEMIYELGSGRARAS